MTWQVINYDEPAYRHYVHDYGSGWLLAAIGVWMCLHLTLRLF